MVVNRVVFALFLVASCSIGAVSADDQHGSFGAKVTDGSELKNYNLLIDRLGHIRDFQELATIQSGSPNDNFENLSKLSKTYVNAVKEIGFPNLPAYPSNKFDYKNIDDFQSRALDAMMESEFEPNNETCGASIVFLYPALVASTLQDIKPEYIEPQSTPARIAALRRAAQYDLKNDRSVLESMCNTAQGQSAVQGIDGLLSLLRGDSTSFLMSIEGESGKNIPTISTAKPKQPIAEPFLETPKRPYIAAKAEDYSNCAAVIGALRQYSADNGLAYNEASTHDLETSFMIASIIYSDADKFMQHYQAMLYSNTVQMQQHPEQMKYWVNQTYQRCATNFNGDRSYINAHQQEGRNEFVEKSQAILKSLQSTR